jgi:hypothetical protein
VARRYFRRFRAAFLISQKYKRFKLTRFFNQILRVFADVKKDPLLGRGLQAAQCGFYSLCCSTLSLTPLDLVWPTPPPILNSFVANLQRIHRNWRAYIIISK